MSQNNILEDDHLYEDDKKRLKNSKSVPLINCKPENDPF